MRRTLISVTMRMVLVSGGGRFMDDGFIVFKKWKDNVKKHNIEKQESDENMMADVFCLRKIE